jgi:hypothetical protein
LKKACTLFLNRIIGFPVIVLNRVCVRFGKLA